MKSQSSRVGRDPKFNQRVFLCKAWIPYPTAAVWSFRLTSSAPCSVLTPRHSHHLSSQLWGPRNQSCLGSSWQPSVTLRILGFEVDYNPRGPDSVPIHWQEAAESQKDARTGRSTPTLSCSSHWPPCVPHGLAALAALALPHASHWRGTHEVFVERKESVHPTAFTQSSLRGNLREEGPVTFKDSKASHFTYFLWNCFQYSVTVSPKSIHSSAVCFLDCSMIVPWVWSSINPAKPRVSTTSLAP